MRGLEPPPPLPGYATSLLFVFHQYTAYSLSKAEVLPLGYGILE